MCIRDSNNIELLKKAKRKGFSDRHIAHLWKCEEIDIYNLRKKYGILHVYKTVSYTHLSVNQ